MAPPQVGGATYLTCSQEIQTDHQTYRQTNRQTGPILYMVHLHRPWPSVLESEPLFSLSLCRIYTAPLTGVFAAASRHHAPTMAQRLLPSQPRVACSSVFDSGLCCLRTQCPTYSVRVQDIHSTGVLCPSRPPGSGGMTNTASPTAGSGKSHLFPLPAPTHGTGGRAGGSLPLFARQGFAWAPVWSILGFWGGSWT